MPRGVPSEQTVLTRVARKIFGGERLSHEEFQMAVKARFWTRPDVTYEDYTVVFYEDDDIKGMLCMSAARTVTKKEKTGESFKVCIFGIHAHQVKRDSLMPRQVRLFTNAGWDESQLGSGIADQKPAHKPKEVEA